MTFDNDMALRHFEVLIDGLRDGLASAELVDGLIGRSAACRPEPRASTLDSGRPVKSAPPGVGRA